MNRSINSRSDLYALGVTFYQMITGVLPFTASDPMEWVHCHIARRPVPPAERLENVPTQVSHIIMKLLAKTAEERYQTAAGVEGDLRRCLAEWNERRRIDDFPLGEHDVPDRLLIPEKLYGRAREIETLLGVFDRIAKNGAPELVLVFGPAGVGKSSVVNELHKVLVPTRGLFASGKFDQYKRDVPYSTLAQAFQSLIRLLLAKSEAELAPWRDALREALGPNGRLMVDLVPELKLIIGDQPPVPELPPQQAQSRFQLVFRRFINAFARPEHPLAVFLDDLQWLDMATLDLLENLLTRSDLRHLMLIGAYRDNEVNEQHPLARMLERVRLAGAIVHDIRLAPLQLDDLTQLIADCLSCGPAQAARLAGLIHDKTLGNPLFAMQFLSALVEDQLLHFDPAAQRWKWEDDRITAKSVTDNVVDLMVGKLRRLPEVTQTALKMLACVGNEVETRILEMALGSSRKALEASLSPAVHTGFVLGRNGSYKFLHDRIQEAAYSLIPECERAGTHLQIGRALLAGMSPRQLSEHMFEVVGQLNHGAIGFCRGDLQDRMGRSNLAVALLSDPDERRRVAELNLRAGQRAKQSTAYDSARQFLSVGTALIGALDWASAYDLIFSLSLERAECEFLCSNFELAEQLIGELLEHAASRTDQAAVFRLKVVLHVMRSEYRQAVVSALACLRLFGIDMPAHPTSGQVEAAYQAVWRKLGDRPVEGLIDLPIMTDPDMLAVMGMLSDLSAPAHVTDLNLMRLNTCHMVSVTLEHGTAAASTFGYSWFGAILGPAFHRYTDSPRFAQLAVNLVRKHDFLAYKAKAYLAAGLVAFWTQPINAAIDFIRAALQAGVEAGDPSFVCYSHNYLVAVLLARGDPLDEVWEASEKGLSFAREVNFRDAADIIVSQQRFIQNMRGLTAHFSTFNYAQFDETVFEATLTPERMPTMVCWYWVLKLQARVISGDHHAAIEAADKANALLWSSDAQIHLADCHYYSALAIAGACETASPGTQHALPAMLDAHRERLREWAHNCAPVFRDRYALVAAEMARIKGQELEAERLYEQAIRAARENGFLLNEAIANELAARFYFDRDFETTAYAYLRNARYCYSRWGAAGKVRQLEQRFPGLHEEQALPSGTTTVATPVEQLDLATVIKLSQAVTGTIVLERLLITIMRTAIEQAGAERGLLILQRRTEPRIEAEATADGDAVIVQMRNEAVTSTVLPESVLHYVFRTRETVVLDDAAAQDPFATDPYIHQRQVRSVLCLPLLNQGKLVGVLYLENNLAPRIFAAARIAVLKLLASQAAIALENARLYRDLAEQGAKIRRLVDANIIGIYLWNFDGRILEANDAFLRIVGYDRDDLTSGRVRWTDLTPPEWRDRGEPLLREHKVTGRRQPFEKEYYRKDGSRVPVLIGGATFEEGSNEGVAFVLDLSARKRAEAEARESERRFRDVQMELAHANRLATMGQLTASIAHEVNQPIGAARNNASAALRFLNRSPPDLEEITEALRCVVNDTARAGDIIGRIRDQIKKAPPRRDKFDLNDAINNVIALVGGEVAKNRVSVRTRLAEGLPRVYGDRVQVQQVVLNLIVNAVEAMSSVDDGVRELMISSEQSQVHGILVAVRDSGPGIDRENLERVFETFYTTKSSGMGMGLSICRSIIEAHGGRLWVEAIVPRGSIFQFSLAAGKRIHESSPSDLPRSRAE